MLPVNPLFFSHDSSNTISSNNLNAKIKLLEAASALNVSEKLNIIALLLGYKWVTDVAIDKKSNWTVVRRILDDLKLPHQQNHYFYKEEKHEWIQVAASERLLEYILSHRDDLSVIEAGVLYGYPVSHSLGYMELIQKQWKNNKTIAEFYFSGVFSKAYHSRESEHFETVWQHVSSCSDVITRQAKDFYQQSK